MIIKFALILAAMAAIVGIGWPLVSSIVGGGQNEATQLVEAADRTQNKAQSLSRSYNDVIPPPDPLAASPGNVGSSPTANAGGRPDGNAGATDEPTSTPSPTLTPTEHAVKDAIDFLNRAQQELEPGTTEYLQAVNGLKAAWDPRYAKAVDEFRRFKYRVDHAREMSAEYVEIQGRLTRNISNREVRERLEEVDALERELIVEWLAQAADVLAQAETIKINLDDMNIRITKLELSATFASVYEGFHRMPLALTMLNGELALFEQETERIYQVFGPKAQQ